MRLNNLQAPPGAFPLEAEGITAAYRDKPVLWDVRCPAPAAHAAAASRDKPVLWGVSFRVPEGQRVAIVGPNGAGKTTLLKIIMDLMKPAAGQATVYGRPFSKARQWVGYVPQRGSVDWDFPTNALGAVPTGLSGGRRGPRARAGPGAVRLPGYGRVGPLGRAGRRGGEAAMECLAKVGMAAFAGRQISQ